MKEEIEHQKQQTRFEKKKLENQAEQIKKQ